MAIDYISECVSRFIQPFDRPIVTASRFILQKAQGNRNEAPALDQNYAV